ncbi:MAG: acetate kinase [Clostridiales bacterium]|nr:acetate kinase [Clostridiales bacterium]
MNVLVINAGSSSLKYQLINMVDQQVLCKGQVERIGIEGSFLKQKGGAEEADIHAEIKNHNDAIQMVLEALTDAKHGVVKSLEEIDAVGHRVLHGGEKFADPVLVDEQVIHDLEAIVDLGPLHMPANISGIKACQQAMPVPQVAVFDTGFHQTMPPKAYLYGLPYEAYEKHKVRRYGFHGTSHLFVSQRAAELRGTEKGRMITCHLGNGSSLCAILDGKCMDTSMGLTPLEGVVMGTRSGDMDPAIVKFIMEKEHKTIEEMDHYLNKESGVYGLSGVSSDFRDLAKAAAEGHRRAILALDVFIYRIQKYIGAYAAALGGVDTLVFTAGIGENDAKMRKDILTGMEWLGIQLDDEANQQRGEHKISAPDSKVEVWVIPTNEELVIARETVRLAKQAKA